MENSGPTRMKRTVKPGLRHMSVEYGGTEKSACRTLTKGEEIEYDAQIQEFWKHMSTTHRMDCAQLEEAFMAPQPLEAMQNWRGM